MATPMVATVFGVLGNIVSFLVYLSPMPTFYRIFKKKSTEGFQSIPYSVALFSAMLYLYYAFLKKNVLILVTINSFGSVVEVGYLVTYLIYATKESRVFTTKLLMLFNVSLLGFIIAATHFLANGDTRVKIVGWICAAFSVSVFAAPLSIMRRVIQTKSVEFMPFTLSLFLTICAVVWFFYGFLIHDFYIATPNIVGFVLGIAQMTLYVVYKKKSPKKNILPVEITKVHDLQTSTIIVEMKAIDPQPQDRDLENPTVKHELEIVVNVLDYGEQVPANIVVCPPV
ncbi:hypothetical protein ACP275_04G014900 [Erythranthe tilingii]